MQIQPDELFGHPDESLVFYELPLLSAKNGTERRKEWHAPMIAQASAARYTHASSHVHTVIGSIYMYVNGDDRITQPAPQHARADGYNVSIIGCCYSTRLNPSRIDLAVAWFPLPNEPIINEARYRSRTIYTPG